MVEPIVVDIIHKFSRAIVIISHIETGIKCNSYKKIHGRKQASLSQVYELLKCVLLQYAFCNRTAQVIATFIPETYNYL